MRILYLLMPLLLTACTYLSPLPSAPEARTVPWPVREAQLAKLQAWILHGSVFIRHENRTWSFRLRWEQAGSGQYQIHLFGPMGGGVGHLQGTPQLTVFTDAEGKSVQADDAESLLAREVGWQLPLVGLQSWLKGMPIAAVATQRQFDFARRLQTLHQQGWTIQYKRYSLVDRLQLPSRIDMQRAGWTVRMVVAEWQIGDKQ